MIHVQARGFALSDAIRQYAEKRLRFALPLDHKRVLRVALTLSDVNGPRGGVDKKCRIQVVLKGRASLVIEDTQPDAYVAMDGASERIAACMYRLLERGKIRSRVSRAAPVEPRALIEETLVKAPLHPQTLDRATLRRWAAEHISVELGVLRECPYHGEPYRPQNAPAVPSSYCGYASHDPLVSVFGGDPGELLAEVERIASDCPTACPTCVREIPE